VIDLDIFLVAGHALCAGYAWEAYRKPCAICAATCRPDGTKIGLQHGGYGHFCRVAETDFSCGATRQGSGFKPATLDDLIKEKTKLG
jgi:hypothetical protein